ncbi:MAG: NUDIX hydrolase [Cellulomonadaceae bacterium]|nr:NUDIX hydrolase [Cellulomonadaceae bacterium]
MESTDLTESAEPTEPAEAEPSLGALAGPRPPGGAPLRVNPHRLRPIPGAPPGSGGLAPLPEPTVTPSHLPVTKETSAGGVVIRIPVDDDGTMHAAVITRRNRAGRLEWCLPKGHLEGKETPPQAARREVFEETGIRGEICSTLGLIDYWFSGDTRRIHKVVHHFLLRQTGGYLTVEFDPDQEAEESHWIPVTELPSRLNYPNEQKLAIVARDVLAAQPELLDQTMEEEG